jgi:hypothetical protein
MPKKQSKQKLPVTKRSSPGKNVLLSLTLVPMILGIIFLGAWALDIEILGDIQSQITVGIFFFLLTFTTSNAIQKRWMLASGWGLLAVADIVTLAWLNITAQVIAMTVGLIGVVLLGVEFYRQYQRGKSK